MASLDLEFSEAIANDGGGPGAYRITLRAINEVDITNKIFVCEASEIEGQEDAFLCVATVEDILSLPDAPDVENEQLRYRADEIDLYFTAYDIADEFLDSVARRVQSLLFAYKALDNMSAPQTLSFQS